MTTPTPRTDVCLITCPVCGSESATSNEATINKELFGLRRELAAARSDIEAYRGALGYSVSGSHDGRLADGTLPANGIAEALHQQLAAAQERAQRAEAAVKLCLDAALVAKERVDAAREPK